MDGIIPQIPSICAQIKENFIIIECDKEGAFETFKWVIDEVYNAHQQKLKQQVLEVTNDQASVFTRIVNKVTEAWQEYSAHFKND